MKTKISRHALKRIEERAGVSSKKKQKKLANDALIYGKPKESFQGKFYEYLRTHFKRPSNNTKIKVFKKMVFIFKGDKRKNLVTVVKVPKYLGDPKEYMKNKTH